MLLRTATTSCYVSVRLLHLGVHHWKAYARLYLETGALLFREASSKVIIAPKVDEADSVELDLKHRQAQNGWSATCIVERSKAKYR